MSKTKNMKSVRKLEFVVAWESLIDLVDPFTMWIGGIWEENNLWEKKRQIRSLMIIACGINKPMKITWKWLKE